MNKVRELECKRTIDGAREKNLNKMMTFLVHSEGNKRNETRTNTHTMRAYNAFECVISVYLILTTRKVNFCMTDDDIDNVNVIVIAAVVALISPIQ